MEFEKDLILDSQNVTLTKMNHIIEIQYMEKRNYKARIKKINDTKYVHIGTGEIREFEFKAKNRSESINSMYKTLKRLRYLINNNFIGAKNELFITLTYKENMQDTEQLYKDMDKFIKRLRYRYRNISTVDYINVVEPQQRGAWHCHLLLRFNDVEKIYIPNEEVRSLWGHGFVRVNRLEDVDNIGAYLTAYLTDLPLEELDSIDASKSFEIKEVDNKKYIKGARLYLYPPGMNLYRHSRGIKKPDRLNMSYKEAKKYVEGATPTYSRKINYESDEFENTIIYEHYNTKRITNKV